MSYSPRFIVWIKETRSSRWEEQGEGSFTFATAKRIAKEIGYMCAAVRVLPVGTEPAPRSEIKQERNEV